MVTALDQEIEVKIAREESSDSDQDTELLQPEDKPIKPSVFSDKKGHTCVRFCSLTVVVLIVYDFHA